MNGEEHKTAVVLGATGLVGQHLLEKLLHDKRYQKVRAVVRSGSKLIDHPKLEIVRTDFQHHDWFPALQADHIYCCLGTTIKKAGNKEAFRHVDYELVLEAASMAAHYRAHFLVISALGADAKSSVFYNRVKGEMEQALQQLALPKLSIFQPSLLAGPRDEFRLGEKLALLVAWLLPAKWRSIHVDKVAIAMMYAAFHQAVPERTYSSALMQELH